MSLVWKNHIYVYIYTIHNIQVIESKWNLAKKKSGILYCARRLQLQDSLIVVLIRNKHRNKQVSKRIPIRRCPLANAMEYHAH